jgi:hypothetical protein
VIDVVCETYRHAAVGRAPDRIDEDRRRLIAEVQVIEGDVDAPRRGPDEQGELLDDGTRGLAAGRERTKADRLFAWGQSVDGKSP